MFCENCGSQVKEGAAFCGNCGTTVSVPIHPATEQTGKKMGGESVSGGKTFFASRRTRFVLGGGGVVIVALVAALAIRSLVMPSPFEKYCETVSQGIENAESFLQEYENFAAYLTAFEKAVGTLSDADYDKKDQISADINEKTGNHQAQLKTTETVMKSITSDGLYTGTMRRIRGWDPVMYANLTGRFSSINQRASSLVESLNRIDQELIKRPNKPFNPAAFELMSEVKKEISAAQSDVVAKNWTAGTEAVERANNALKEAVSLGLNDVEQYQITQLQADLKKVAEEVSSGATWKKVGDFVEDNAEDFITGFLGGLLGIW